MGDDLLRPTISNPLGYFEDRGINDLNNVIIQTMLAWPRGNRVRAWFAPLAHHNRRLFPSAAPRRLKAPKLTEDVTKQIQDYVSHQPFLFKDPRFSVTLEAWRPLLPANMKYIVIFREPGKIAQSYVLNGERMYGLKVPVDWVFVSFARNYQRLLDQFVDSGDALFVHYDDILSEKCIPDLCAFLGVSHVNRGHLRPTLKRSTTADGNGRAVARADSVYRNLCEVAGFEA